MPFKNNRKRTNIMSGAHIAVLITAALMIVTGSFVSVLFGQLSAEQYLRQDTAEVSEILVTMVRKEIADDKKLSMISKDGPCFVINHEHAPGSGLCELFRRSRPSGQCRPVVVIGELSEGLWPRVRELNVALVSEIVADRANITTTLQKMRPDAGVSSVTCDDFTAFQVTYGKEGR